MQKDIVVIVVNGALVAGLIALVALGKIDWSQFGVGVGLLAVPSVLQRKSGE